MTGLDDDYLGFWAPELLRSHIWAGLQSAIVFEEINKWMKGTHGDIYSSRNHMCNVERVLSHAMQVRKRPADAH